MKRTVLAGLLCLLPAVALADPFLAPLGLRTNDVVALVGGGTTVALSRDGLLETTISGLRPELGLRFRNLAWEGDTVFAQPRELNYPVLATQLQEERATVVFVEFGQSESFAGPEGLPVFRGALGRFLDGLGAAGLRSVLVTPVVAAGVEAPHLDTYAEAVRETARSRSLPLLDLAGSPISKVAPSPSPAKSRVPSPADLAERIGTAVRRIDTRFRMPAVDAAGRFQDPGWESLRTAVVERNRLWKQAVRPTNWAFLAGDRPDQRFSRDPVDPSRRTFPEEMKAFGPLLAEADGAVTAAARSLGPDWNAR